MTPEEDPIEAKLTKRALSREQRDGVSKQLSELGFEVIRTSRSGTVVKGNPALYETLFSTSLEIEGESPKFVKEPKIPKELADVVDSIYFPTKPTPFPSPLKSKPKNEIE